MRIEPYNDSEVNKVLTDLLNNQEFINFVKTNLSGSKSKFLSSLILSKNSYLIIQGL